MGAERRLGRGLDALARERLAVDDEGAVADLRAPQQLAARAHRGPRGLLGAPDALQLGLVLRAAAVDEKVAVGTHLDAVLAQRVRQLQPERVRHDRLRHAELLRRPQHGLQQRALAVEPLVEELVEAELLGRVRLEPAAQVLEPRHLEAADDRVAVAVPLDVQNRIGDGDGHLVPRLGGTDRVAEDEDVGHGRES